MADIRNDCLNMIVDVLEEHRPSHLVIADHLDAGSGMSDQDRSFVKRLVMGVVERKMMLDHVIDAVSKTKTAKMKPVVRNIIRMGAYQLIYMNVPDSAACNESVKLAKKRGLVNLSGFVNGVLRNIARQKDILTDLSGIKDDTVRLSLYYSVPEWIVRYFCDNYGIEAAVRAFEHYLTPSKTYIRCNSSRISPDGLCERLTERGIDVQRTGIERCMSITGYSSLNSIPEFRDGLFSVQDMSSVIAGEIAEIRGDERVLDMCAAPGGKSLNIADRLTAVKRAGVQAAEKGTAGTTGPEAAEKETAGTGASDGGQVIACDISEQKVRMIDENIVRSGFTNIRTAVSDATVFVPDFENAFDIVIADVPCSGLGIIGRKPDIKYNMTPEGQNELVILQRSILDNAVRYVKTGGQLLFSTCTVNRAENEDNVGYIAAKGFECALSKQLLPGENGADGFFYARMIRK